MLSPTNAIIMAYDNVTEIKGGCPVCKKEWKITIDTIKYNQYLKGEKTDILACITFTLETNICFKCREIVEGEVKNATGIGNIVFDDQRAVSGYDTSVGET